MNVLIAVLSCRGYETRRESQRDTWMKDIREWSGVNVDCRFFLGGQEPRFFLEQEPSIWSDEVFLACDDRYDALPSKIAAIARWALDAGYDFIFKCDDDTYVRPSRLLASGFQGCDYLGFIEDRDCHLRAYPFPVYPHAQGGPGYWLSRKAMQVVASQLPNIPQEDFAVGEALARAGIPASHDERYVHVPEFPQEGVRPDFISLHKCDPAEMHRVHEHFQVLLQA